MKTIEDIRDFKPSKEFTDACDKMGKKLQESMEAVWRETSPSQIYTEFKESAK